MQFFPTEKTENERFKEIVTNRLQNKYFPSFKAADILGLSGKAVSKITSSFMVVGSDGSKSNLGLSLKFEGKGLKVIEYSRKDGRYWEFSGKAMELIDEYKVCHRSLHKWAQLSDVPYQSTYPEVFSVLDRSGDGASLNVRLYAYGLAHILLAMVKAADVFANTKNPDAKVKEIKTWLNSKGVRDFEPVSLFCDQLGKVLWRLYGYHGFPDVRKHRKR